MGRRLNAIIEVSLIFILILIVPILTIQALKSIWFLYSNLTIIYHLFYAAVILTLLVMERRDLTEYGITLKNFNNDLKVVVICIVPLLITIIPTFVFNMGGLAGNLLYYVGQLLMLLVVVYLLSKVPIKDNKASIAVRVVVPAMCLVLMSGAVVFASSLVLTLTYELFVFFLFVGPMEELVFRGYMQSRLNEAFGRPYQFFGISWGAGLIIASLLFGLLHVFKSPFNPLIGNYSLSLLSGLGTFLTGMIMGFIREKTGTIVAPSILHSTCDFVMEFFMYV